MRSRLLLAAVCAAFVLTAGTAQAQQAGADVFTGKIGPGKTKLFNITTDSSAIIRIKVVTFKATDADMIVLDETDSARLTRDFTVTDDDDENDNDLDDNGIPDNALGVFNAGVTYVEEGVISVAGGKSLTICLTGSSGPLSRFVLTFVTEVAAGVSEGSAGSIGGPGVIITEAGEFSSDRPAGPGLASLQRSIEKWVALKR